MERPDEAKERRSGAGDALGIFHVTQRPRTHTDSMWVDGLSVYELYVWDGMGKGSRSQESLSLALNPFGSPDRRAQPTPSSGFTRAKLAALFVSSDWLTVNLTRPLRYMMYGLTSTVPPTPTKTLTDCVMTWPWLWVRYRVGFRMVGHNNNTRRHVHCIVVVYHVSRSRFLCWSVIPHASHGTPGPQCGNDQTQS